ncbi:MAG: aminotransferase class V-fold PLP-dependent enzyme [Acidimicrobiia bacterium]
MDPWLLDPDLTYLNHGSFGACPRPVLDQVHRWQARFEANPVAFVEETYRPALAAARGELAGFVAADPAGLVFVRNATEGVNAVLRSIEPLLEPGDEILQTDHGYNACRNAAEVTALRTGASVITAPLPFPVARPDEMVEAVLSKVTDRTRLAVIDHVTSPTALVLPVDRIVGELEPRVPVLVDGAHAPGMLPLKVEALGASFYTGNCHKWLCAARGAGFLWVHEEWRDRMLPPVVSHGWNTVPEGSTRFRELFDWTGTDDPSAWLSVPAAIRFLGSLDPAGPPAVMAANHGLVLAGRDELARRLAIDPPVPDPMLGSMASLPLPGPAGAGGGGLDPLTSRLRHEHQIEVPVFRWGGRRLLRISAQRYNRVEDYQRLGEVLARVL